MNKIFLIMSREFLSRVKKRTFLLATLLTPLIFSAVIGGMAYLVKQETENVQQKTVLMLDPKDYFPGLSSDRFNIVTSVEDSATLHSRFRESEDIAVLLLPGKDSLNFNLLVKKDLTFSERSSIERLLEGRIRERNMELLNLTEETERALAPNVELNSYNVVSESKSSSGAAFAIGYIAGFLIYMFIFLYGAQVMQGIIAEKTNKIVEVLLATVKPFQLMMGKVIGIASVGLAQFVIWVIMTGLISTLVFGYFGIETGNTAEVQQAMQQTSQPDIIGIIAGIDFIPIILMFIFYFLGGYFLYGALFAAVGSAVDTPQDAQQFMFPISLPLIASIMGLGVVLDNPDGNVSFWMSIIPFTSPVTMMARIGFGFPPLWQIILSMAMLVAGIYFTVWVASRIYRVGILMHGTKVNYKTLARWFMQKN